jgi:hypothetical protein
VIDNPTTAISSDVNFKLILASPTLCETLTEHEFPVAIGGGHLKVFTFETVVPFLDKSVFTQLTVTNDNKMIYFNILRLPFYSMIFGARFIVIAKLSPIK